MRCWNAPLGVGTTYNSAGEFPSGNEHFTSHVGRLKHDRPDAMFTVSSGFHRAYPKNPYDPDVQSPSTPGTLVATPP